PDHQREHAHQPEDAARRGDAHRADGDGARRQHDGEPEEESCRPAPVPLAVRGEPAKQRDGEERERGRDQHHRRRPRVRDAVPEVRDRHGYSLGCRRPAARYAARLPGALLLQVLRVAQPLRWREVLRRETERAWPITLAVVTGILGAVGNIVFREVIIGCKWLFRDKPERLGGGIPLALVAGGLGLLPLDRPFPGEVLGYGFPRFLEMLHLQG